MGDRYRGRQTNPPTTHNGCLFPALPANCSCDTPRSRYPVELVWQASPGGGPLVINADGSLSISNSPFIRQCSSNTTDSASSSTCVMQTDDSLRIGVSVEVSRSQSAPVTTYRKATKPEGTMPTEHARGKPRKSKCKLSHGSWTYLHCVHTLDTTSNYKL